MAGNPFTQLVFDLFIISAILITAYTCNFYYLVLLANKRNKSTKTVDLGTPSVTIQLPIYNEKYVAKRLVDAVCDLDYPKNQMNIMVLDDSDDDTVDLLEKTVNYYKTQGFQIEHIRRGTRKGQTLVTEKPGDEAKGKFGRILGKFRVYDSVTDSWMFMGDIMVREGYAVPYQGGSKEELVEMHLANRNKLIAKGVVTL